MKILVFAPHNDDEVLGVGGTIRRYIESGHQVTVCEVTYYKKDYLSLQEEAKRAHQLLGVQETIFLNLPVVYLKNLPPAELNMAIGNVVKDVRPDIVFTPFIGDMHTDHREVTDSVLVAVRPVNDCSVKTVYMYETLSETGWNIPSGERSFIPDTYVDISSTIEKKIQAMECYQSQLKDYPNPRSREAIKALAMYRGSMVSLYYAEAFMLVRNIIQKM